MPPAPLAVSLGDPAGIGPELLCRAWLARDEQRLMPFFVVGGAKVLAAAAKACGLDVPINPITEPADAATVFAGGLPVLGALDAEYRPGQPDTSGAKLALHSLQRASDLAASGVAAGVVTAPVSKARLVEVGFAHPGQTEYMAAVCERPVEDAVMMLAGPQLRTVPVTVHCALLQVPALLTAALIEHRTRIVAAALREDFGLENPRIAVAALNPHAGEEGAFGDEESTIIQPALDALTAAEIDVTGPHPADALFAPRARQNYDAAICMYHDQALIPLKALDFDAGVNVTLGLPIVRTSPDHGTAFDIAGKGIADAGATIAALKMAGEIATRRAAS
ncbi:4-hydroxythreonine-4-phosphate dehydrogenase PdxA [Altererythrobacter sp. ZODW24]|uniref:4-hydroxythreonine-4-phosphate dehydrogenase PdxA n=1 Tax=Altererythrobacter sp. ZODW24 TaxID=2185142 RepID=UPI000DF7B2EC|nr:4-hydroxythreonine-4-phosphate dehydrogenase PdxA [Altererythrobacter sp. ZODW24]